ncbi:MAG: hypothetical protein AAF721_11520 [Myxococcota bacterium]
MGYVGMPRLIASAVFAATVLAGCGSFSDPATPCRSMDLGHARQATFVTPKSAPIIAMTDAEPLILHEVCDEDSCYLKNEPLEGLSQGSHVLLTSTGDYAIAIDRKIGTVHSYGISSVADVSGRAVERIASIPSDAKVPKYLVASMRGNNYVVARTSDLGLARYFPGDSVAEPIAPDIDNLRVVAVGEQYLVGRQIHSSGEESLYLVAVTPEVRLKRPKKLIRGRTFSRVVLTPGDERVIATTGEGADAKTFVFSVSDGRQIDRFDGAAVSGRPGAEELPGLRGVSPDGSHVAFRTPGGGLAMRDLDLQASCLVRSSSTADHRLAGFAPNGVLYMEAEEAVGRTRVLAFDPITRDLVALGEQGHDYRLAAVAAHMPGEPEPGVDEGRDAMRHWAVAVEQGTYTAVSEGVSSAPLELTEVSFMARDDGAVWLLDGKTSKNNGNQHELAVHRISPKSTDQGLRFVGGEASRPNYPQTTDPEVKGFVANVGFASNVCVSTGIPGAWAVRCNGGPTSSKFLSSSSGATEDPQAPEDIPDPVPADDEG